MADLNVEKALAVYAPADDRDCSQEQFRGRIEQCAACPHRLKNICRLDAQIVTVRARRKDSTCFVGLWPEAQRVQENAPDVPVLATPVKTGPRVGFVFPVWQALGGVERHTLTLIKYAQGVQWSGLAALYPHLVNREALSRLNRHMRATQADGLAALKANSDILIVWGFTSCVDGWLSDFRGRVVAITHGEGAFSANQLLPVLPYASGYVSVSAAGVGMFPEVYRNRVKVIHNGIEFDRIAPSRSRAECRAALGIDDTDFVIGTLGRLSEEKNPLAAARAVAELGGNAVALYVGDNGDAKTADETMAEAERIAPSRIIWHRHVNHEAIGDYYRAMDVFLMSSRAEGGPLVSAEAWFAGVPQVATPVGMIPELERRHGQMTWHIPINPTARELAAAIRSAAGGGERVQLARDVTLAELSAATFARNWSQYLRSL